MKHRYFQTLCVALMLVSMLCLGNSTKAQEHKKSVDFFLGADFGISDMNWHRQYDILIAAMPGFKWDLGNHWLVAGGLYIPIVNQISFELEGVRINTLNISKQVKLGNFYCKATGGLFSTERYGLDLKMFLPVADWFAFEAQAGLTGKCSFGRGQMLIHWVMSDMKRFTGTIGGDIYLKRWNTQLRGVVGTFLYKDLGVECEAIRHFNHSSVSLFGNWNNKEGIDAGFRVVAMLPPYKRTHRTVNFRPMSNFKFDYLMSGHTSALRRYKTDPEENMREGWFSRNLLQWGANTMEPDFIINGKEVEK